MEDNIVTSEDVAPKKPAKKVAKKQTETAKPKKVASERNDSEFIAEAPEGYKFVYFDSGHSYITVDGYKFSAEQRIHLLPDEEADHLLSLENFRLPDQLELLEHSNGIDE